MNVLLLEKKKDQDNSKIFLEALGHRVTSLCRPKRGDMAGWQTMLATLCATDILFCAGDTDICDKLLIDLARMMGKETMYRAELFTAKQEK